MRTLSPSLSPLALFASTAAAQRSIKGTGNVRHRRLRPRLAGLRQPAGRHPDPRRHHQRPLRHARPSASPPAPRTAAPAVRAGHEELRRGEPRGAREGHLPRPGRGDRRAHRDQRLRGLAPGRRGAADELRARSSRARARRATTSPRRSSRRCTPTRRLGCGQRLARSSRARRRRPRRVSPVVNTGARMRPSRLAALLSRRSRLAAPASARSGRRAATARRTGERHLADSRAGARERLAEDPGWLRLGHWRRGLGAAGRARPTGASSSSRSAGRPTRAAELEATLAGFFDAGPKADELDDAQCRFPARFAFLAGRLGFDLARLPPRRCPRFEDFFERLQPRAARRSSSPPTTSTTRPRAFGHTFLRLDKADRRRRARRGAARLRRRLLGHGRHRERPPLRGPRGSSASSRGEFNHYPYYYKVREYAEYESRDLWEYDLALTPGEVAMLAGHLWELGGTWFDYWYLDENCSYHVLGALEAAAPRLDLLSHVGPVVVLPSDTVKALFPNPGLVRGVHYRPSIRTQFRRAARAPSTTRELEPRRAARRGPGRAAPRGARRRPRQARGARRRARPPRPAPRARARPRQGARRAARDRQALLERRSALAGAEPAARARAAARAARPERGHGSHRAGAGGGVPRATAALAAARPAALAPRPRRPARRLPAARADRVPPGRGCARAAERRGSRSTTPRSCGSCR